MFTAAVAVMFIICTVFIMNMNPNMIELLHSDLELVRQVIICIIYTWAMASCQ